MINKSQELKTELTLIVQSVIRAKEINKGYVDESYVASKNWHSPLDWPTNKMVLDIIGILKLSESLIRLLYLDEDLECPYTLEARKPKKEI